MNLQETVNQTGWWERTKETLSMKTLGEKFGQYKEIIFEVALYGGIGFLVGFLVRRYSGYIALFISFFILLFFLYRFDILIIAVNWEKLQELFGIKALATDDGDIFAVLWQWVQSNVVLSLSFVIGFFLGLKFG